MGDELEFVDTTLCLGQYNITNPSSSSKNRNRKKQRKLLDLGKSPLGPVTRTISSKMQPGCLIHIAKRSELYDMFCAAKWEPVLYYPNRKVLPNMVSEFYSNLEIKHGLQNVMFVTSVVNGKFFALDHIELTKALKMNLKTLQLANIDITKEFVFNRLEMKLYLSVLCGVEVPPTLELTEKGISYEYFTPLFQNLALILRANFFQNYSADKLMSFPEIKLMYRLASKKVTFSLPYMILTHMVNSYKKGYLTYGLLLTKVFEYFKLNLNQLPYFQVAATISDKVERVTIPLLPVAPPVVESSVPFVSIAQNVSLSDDVGTSKSNSSPKLDFDKEIEKLNKNYQELDTLFQGLHNSFKTIVEKYEHTELKVNGLLNILSNTIARAGVIEEGLAQVINVQLSFLDIPPLPTLVEIEEPLDAIAVGVPVVNRVVDMETDVGDTAAVTSNTPMESLD